MPVPIVELASSKQMPQLGLGLWQVTDEKQCHIAIESALEAGYRHFDTAQIYGNEAYLGSVLAAAKYPRSDLFITTKIWNENQEWDNIVPSFERSLQKLQTDYVDLLLLHFPVTEFRRPAWRKMEQILDVGTAKSIGVSNYTIRHLEELLKECDVKPAVNQVELHVFLQQPELVAFCHENDILVQAYSPLAHGYGLDNPVLRETANKYGKSPAQVMIRWCIEQGLVPLPKSVNPKRVAENVDVFDFTLDKADTEATRNLERNYRTSWDPTNVP